MKTETMDKDYQKKQEAMKKRLKGLDSNPVVEKAIKRQDSDSSYEDFDVVHELVSAAFSKYCDEGEDLKSVLQELGKSILSAAKNVKSEPGEIDEDDY